MHNYIVFDHCQLFRQHTWPNFLFCHNIGIVKVSHKKLTSTFHTPPVCVRTPPPPLDYLHNYIVFDHCQLFLQLFPQHRYLTRIHILPQHRHCGGLPHKFNIRYTVALAWHGPSRAMARPLEMLLGPRWGQGPTFKS